jgi:hypothetical protein
MLRSNWPASFCALAVFLIALSAYAQLPNAWQITDSTNTAGGSLNFTNLLPAGVSQQATNGFTFSVNSRFVTDYASGSSTMLMLYSDGSKRWEVLWSLTNGDLASFLITNVNPVQGLRFVVTTNGSGTALYHTHQIIYTNGTASYLVDGQPLTTNWAGGTASGLPAGEIIWGAGSSSGRGQMNFHSISFIVTNGAVAGYDAGNEGIPAIAPDSAGLGWTLSPPSPPAGTSTNAISPDTVLLPMAITRPADQFMHDSARLNGFVNPSGSPTGAWFEWGTSTNYGNVSAMQLVGSGLNLSDVNGVIGPLNVGPDYHYRMVASNVFGVVVGTNRTFNLASMLPVTSTFPVDPAAVEPYQTTLAGTVIPSGLDTSTWFEWGTTTNYGTYTAIVNIPAPVISTNLTVTISGLLKGTTYYFRSVATNSVGTSQTADFTFTTPPWFVVTTLADHGNGSLRQSIAHAQSGDTITFATNGTITLTSGELKVTNDLTITGPGPTNLAVSGNNASRVFNVTSNSNTSISGISIRNGRAPTGDTGDPGGSGGGILSFGTLALSNCVITANTAGNGGNAAVSDNGGVGGNGGGIYSAGTLSLTVCTVSTNMGGNGGMGGHGFSGNETSADGNPGGAGGSAGRGGGIYNLGTLTLTACTINANKGGTGGTGGTGGDGFFGLPSLFGMGGKGGSAGAGGSGGGIFNNGLNLVLNHCTMANNAAGAGGKGGTGGPGAGIALGGDGGPGGPGGNGGAIFNAAPLALTACTIFQNLSGSGGAGGTEGPPGVSGLIGGRGGNGGLGGSGGGLQNGALINPSLRNTLVAQNNLALAGSGGPGTTGINGTNGSSGTGYDLKGQFQSQGYDFVGQNDSAFTWYSAVGDIIPSAGNQVGPLLGSLTNNGGHTLTVALLAGSPAIDAGDDSLANTVATDQRGYPRLSGGHVDVGAFEVQVATTYNPPVLRNPGFLTNGAFTFSFTNNPGLSFGVYASSNVALSLSQWTRVGAAAQLMPGQYQFTDAVATNYPTRFYQLRGE